LPSRFLSSRIANNQENERIEEEQEPRHEAGNDPALAHNLQLVIAVYENERRQDDDCFQVAGGKALRANFRVIERREWWLWLTAAIITLLLTGALASFLLPNLSPTTDFHSLHVLPQAVRGLAALVFLFDLYPIYQHLQIHCIRRQLIERQELFHLISENAADMIAVVDLEGRRIFNSLSYQRIPGVRFVRQRHCE